MLDVLGFMLRLLKFSFIDALRINHIIDMHPLHVGLMHNLFKVAAIKV